MPPYRKTIRTFCSRIEESIRSERPLQITYLAWKEHTPKKRRVVFHRLYERSGRLYAEGYCLLRKDERTFRVDRIQNVGELGEKIATKKTASPVKTKERPRPEPVSEYTRSRRESRKESFGTFLKVMAGLIPAGGLLFMIIVVNTPGMYEKVFGSGNDYYSSPRSILYYEEKGRQPAVNPGAPHIEENMYRGIPVDETDSGYTASGFPGSFPTLPEAVRAVNERIFIEKTGLEDEEVLDLYRSADLNGDGILWWDEIKTFQLDIGRRFEYISNDEGLPPDLFFREGGGDCEDWAIFTAGLLEFWGYEVYIGSFCFKDSYHAVTLVRVETLPRRYRGWYIRRAEIDGSVNGDLEPGMFTVIDYHRVGRLTRAAGRKPVLIGVHLCTWYYDRAM